MNSSLNFMLCEAFDADTQNPILSLASNMVRNVPFLSYRPKFYHDFNLWNNGFVFVYDFVILFLQMLNCINLIKGTVQRDGSGRN